MQMRGKTDETSYAGGRHNMPRPLQVDLWPFDLESGVQVTCDVGYLVPILVFLGLSVLDLNPNVRNRQTDVRRASSFNAPNLGAGA